MGTRTFPATSFAHDLCNIGSYLLTHKYAKSTTAIAVVLSSEPIGIQHRHHKLISRPSPDELHSNTIIPIATHDHETPETAPCTTSIAAVGEAYVPIHVAQVELTTKPL